jgi:hypothetical protein
MRECASCLVISHTSGGGLQWNDGLQRKTAGIRTEAFTVLDRVKQSLREFIRD